MKIYPFDVATPEEADNYRPESGQRVAPNLPSPETEARYCPECDHPETDLGTNGLCEHRYIGNVFGGSLTYCGHRCSYPAEPATDSELRDAIVDRAMTKIRDRGTAAPLQSTGSVIQVLRCSECHTPITDRVSGCGLHPLAETYSDTPAPQSTPKSKPICNGNRTGYHTCGLPIGGCQLPQDSDAPETIRVCVRPGNHDWIGVAYAANTTEPDKIREYVPAERIEAICEALSRCVVDEGYDDVVIGKLDWEALKDAIGK